MVDLAAAPDGVQREHVEFVVGAEDAPGELDPGVAEHPARVVRVGAAEGRVRESLGEALAARAVRRCGPVEDEAAPVARGAGSRCLVAGEDDRGVRAAARVDPRAAAEDERRRWWVRRVLAPPDRRAWLDDDLDPGIDEDRAVEEDVAGGGPGLARPQYAAHDGVAAGAVDGRRCSPVAGLEEVARQAHGAKAGPARVAGARGAGVRPAAVSRQLALRADRKHVADDELGCPAIGREDVAGDDAALGVVGHGPALAVHVLADEVVGALPLEVRLARRRDRRAGRVGRDPRGRKLLCLGRLRAAAADLEEGARQVHRTEAGPARRTGARDAGVRPAAGGRQRALSIDRQDVADDKLRRPAVRREDVAGDDLALRVVGHGPALAVDVLADQCVGALRLEARLARRCAWRGRQAGQKGQRARAHNPARGKGPRSIPHANLPAVRPGGCPGGMVRASKPGIPWTGIRMMTTPVRLRNRDGARLRP